MIFFLANQVPKIFTSDELINKEAPIALKIVFSLLPIVGIQLIGAAYFQAIGKALPALLLTLTRQAFFFIPLVFFFSYTYYNQKRGSCNPLMCHFINWFLSGLLVP